MLTVFAYLQAALHSALSGRKDARGQNTVEMVILIGGILLIVAAAIGAIGAFVNSNVPANP